MRGSLYAAILVLATGFPAGAHTRPRLELRRRRAPTETLAPYSPSPRGLYHPRMTWYEFMLHQLNPHDRDYGAWYRERRAALVAASIRNQYFWYAFWATVALIFVVPWLIKSLYDSRKKERIMDDMMDKVRAHDAHSRQVAHEAIRRYNEHIELCNRAIEESEGSGAMVLGDGSQPPTLKGQLDVEKEKVRGLESERVRLETELAQKTALVTDLSLRLEAVSKQLGGGNGSEASNGSTSSVAEMVRHINTLEQQLYAEREKNRRLVGGR